MSAMIVEYAVSLAGGDGVPVLSSRRIASPGKIGSTIVSLSMFKGDERDERALAEHARKVLMIAAGSDVAILSVSTAE